MIGWTYDEDYAEKTTTIQGAQQYFFKTRPYSHECLREVTAPLQLSLI